jgi:hypothetical protein
MSGTKSASVVPYSKSAFVKCSSDKQVSGVRKSRTSLDKQRRTLRMKYKTVISMRSRMNTLRLCQHSLDTFVHCSRCMRAHLGMEVQTLLVVLYSLHSCY